MYKKFLQIPVTFFLKNQGKQNSYGKEYGVAISKNASSLTAGRRGSFSEQHGLTYSEFDMGE